MDRQELQSLGLLMFGICVGLNAAGLGLDYALDQAGWPTISQFARSNPWLATTIIFMNVLGVVGLVLHLSILPSRLP
jgi:hypothetical protein